MKGLTDLDFKVWVHEIASEEILETSTSQKEDLASGTCPLSGLWGLGATKPF